MNKCDDVKTWVARFMNGETTLQEEQMLYAYFRDNEVSADLLPMRDLILGLAEMQIQPKECIDQHISKTKSVSMTSDRPIHRPYGIHRYISVSIAAAVACLLIGSAVVYSYRQQNYCEVYVYGKKVTDKTAVMIEVDRTMNTMVNGVPDVDNELKDAFGEK